jgi:hypothetical protein
VLAARGEKTVMVEGDQPTDIVPERGDSQGRRGRRWLHGRGQESPNGSRGDERGPKGREERS